MNVFSTDFFILDVEKIGVWMHFIHRKQRAIHSFLKNCAQNGRIGLRRKTLAGFFNAVEQMIKRFEALGKVLRV